MTAKQVLAEKPPEQSKPPGPTAATERRETFTVSATASLASSKKKLKVDEPLAEELWASGNYDARVRATMIGDPEGMTESTLDSGSRDLDSSLITDAYGGFVARTPFAMTKMKAWMDADHERLETVAWSLLAHAAMTDESLPDSFPDARRRTPSRTFGSHTLGRRPEPG